MKRPRVEVNLGELDQMLDRACEAPLSQTDSAKIKNALHTLAEVLTARRSAEKTREVLGDAAPQSAELQGQPPSKDEKAKTPGHGRHAASCYEGARKVVVTHPELQHGERCSECRSGNVYEQRNRNGWCGSWGRLLCQQLSASCSDCAAYAS